MTNLDVLHIYDKAFIGTPKGSMTDDWDDERRLIAPDGFAHLGTNDGENIFTDILYDEMVVDTMTAMSDEIWTKAEEIAKMIQIYNKHKKDGEKDKQIFCIIQSMPEFSSLSISAIRDRIKRK